MNKFACLGVLGKHNKKCTTFQSNFNFFIKFKGVVIKIIKTQQNNFFGNRDCFLNQVYMEFLPHMVYTFEKKSTFSSFSQKTCRYSSKSKT